VSTLIRRSRSAHQTDRTQKQKHKNTTKDSSSRYKNESRANAKMTMMAFFLLAASLLMVMGVKAFQLPAFIPRAASASITSSIKAKATLLTEDPAFFRRPTKDVIIGKKKQKVLEGTEARGGGFEHMGSFEIVGQGAIGFKFIPSPQYDTITFKLAPKDPVSSSTCLYFIVDTKGARLNQGTNAGSGPLLAEVKSKTAIGLGQNRTFWISLDKENHVIRCGKGYLMKSLQLFEKNIDEEKWNEMGYNNLVDHSMSVFAEDNKVQLITSKYPIYDDLPPLMRSHDEITLDDLDQNSAITIYELSPECRRLYSNVAGKNIQLNTANFTDFSSAIEYSINTPGMTCFNKLIETAQEDFVGNKETYDARMTYDVSENHAGRQSGRLARHPLRNGNLAIWLLQSYPRPCSMQCHHQGFVRLTDGAVLCGAQS
jgi:hypothetical protein